MNVRMRISSKIAALALVVFSALTASAQIAANGPSNDSMSPAEVERIIQTFTRKEIEFRRALNSYSFKRDALVQKIGMGGQVTGEYHRVSTFTFDDSGNRYEKISYFPMSTMPEVTQADLDDMGGIKPFALEPSKIAQYNIRYVGKETIDELNLYIFDVTPKGPLPKFSKTQERFFTGRVWVDDKDLMIVKTKGKGVPEDKTNKFPIVETYREQIDGRYWFPTYSYADEELIFENGGSLHVRMKIRYTDFTPTSATLKVTEIGEDEEGAAAGVAKPIEAGVLNSKATSLPKPIISEEARNAKAIGRVTVRVVVDENGKVVSAEAIDGPSVLRPLAEDAARKATFAPTVKDGITVKVAGVLTYDFYL